MKIIFMGTPAFGATILNELLKEHEISLVVVQPDKPSSRQKLIFSPVKELALKHNLKIFQPLNITKETQAIFLAPCDLIVTAAYGQMIPEAVLNYPPFRSINVHASLLPKYRGGAPIQRALMNGDTKTGISIIYMEKKMDAGDILAQAELAITKDDNASSLFTKLADLGAKMILKTIKDLQSGLIIPKKQDPLAVSYAYNLTKEDERLNFSLPAQKLYYQIKALANSPGAYFMIDGLIYKVYDSDVKELNHRALPGQIIALDKTSFTIACSNNSSLVISRIKPQDRPLMEVKDFLNGKGKNIIVMNRRIE